jgi:hypothetical protein
MEMQLQPALPVGTQIVIMAPVTGPETGPWSRLGRLA